MKVPILFINSIPKKKKNLDQILFYLTLTSIFFCGITGNSKQYVLQVHIDIQSRAILNSTKQALLNLCF